MGFFKRKDKDQDIDFSILDQDDLYLKAKNAAKAAPKSHSLTSEEIIGSNSTERIESTENPLEALRKKMQGKNENQDSKDDFTEIIDVTPGFNIDSSFLNTEKSETVAEITPQKETEKEQPSSTLPKEEINTETIPETQTDETEKSDNESLLNSCMPFIMDGSNGKSPLDDKPSYTLDSVASILGIEEKPKNEPISKKEEKPKVNEKTMVFSAINDSLPDISDVDTNTKAVKGNTVSFTGTIPVIIPDEMITSTIDIPKVTVQSKPTLDLSMSEETVEEEYDSFTPDFEYRNKADRKKIGAMLINERRSRFLKFAISLFSLFILGIFALPAFSDLKITFSPTLAVFTSIAFILASLCNLDVFWSLATLKSKRTSAESGIALTVLLSAFTILFAFINCADGEVYYGIALMSVLSLVFRSYFRFSKSQYIYTNFKKLSADTKHYGITLIDDGPTTFAMARKAIDGDILIAAPKRTQNITNFIKNSNFDIDFDGRARLFFVIGLIASIVLGSAFGYYRNDFTSGIATAALFSAIFAPLTSLACAIMPLSSAASRLNRYGAALTGIRAAKQIEAANACTIDCDALFPKGTIKLADMKVLNQNNLEDTLASACAITETIKSPLAPIFRDIMETNTSVSIPVADSIKYEDKLGLTGWVGNKRIFIGNRALMLAHEIAVPDAEKDKRLMREGYFPVYVACNGKAFALLVLKYIPNPDIAKELDKISAMGLTILVNNCDQNISDEMICDYFDLYSDSVKIMSASGVHMYKTATTSTENMNAGAYLRGGAAATAAIVYCANRVKRANALLQVSHIVSIILGFIIFAYVIFGNTANLTGTYVAFYNIICFALSSIIYLFSKP